MSSFPHAGFVVLAAVLPTRAFAQCDHFALGWLFFCGVGDDQAALGLIFAFDAANQHSVMQRFECHL